MVMKLPPSPCGISCPCNTDSYVEPLSDEDRREIDADSTFVDTADAASYHEGDA
jgi:hypothetical protein